MRRTIEVEIEGLGAQLHYISAASAPEAGASPGLSVVTDTAVLIVSELITNAVQATAEHHPGDAPSRPPTIALRLSCISSSLIIEVWDRDARPPLQREPGDQAEDGRGLLIVESLSTRWAYYRPPAAPGKVTWCQIEVPQIPGIAVPAPPAPGPLPRRPPASAPLVPFQFSDDLDVLQRVADGLRSLDWDLPEG
ncbi:hypothetical protein FDG2_5432 [Candidatus Protofrankia californiensis]|uniref:Histidine kinase/HSP90-like ATPase domain-containing protein n=1 Tax=Candidatus Protofrankia californiensis TaxID=1839754 RepID=A0A1C3PD88_9ACTN|nr:hypothetical protein FDG2_5432 [Candidatus Protofrankia californiensis]